MFSVDSAGVVRIVEARSRPQGWGDISSELLDTICEYLPQQRELLPMREVSKHWNSVVNSVLERRTLQQWTVWQPLVYEAYSSSPFPFLIFGIRNRTASGARRRGDYRNYSSIFVNVDVNPFPSNSLYLDARPPGEQNNLVDYTVLGFLSNHGVHLTSLMLAMVEMAPPKFYRILQQMPNLKAFTLHFDRVSTQSGCLPEGEMLSLSPCPKLEYMRIHERLTDSEKPAQYMWLLKLFATQLISLEVEEIELYQLNLAFPKLQRLKALSPPADYFIETAPNFRAPLQMLCLRKDFLQLVSMTEVLRFLRHFSHSLIYLSLQLDVLEDDVKELMKFPLTSDLCPAFPYVTTFAIDDIDLDAVQNVVRKHFQPRLTNLRTLQLLRFQVSLESDDPVEERRKEAADFCRNAGLWVQFPMLKTIEIYPSTDNYDQILSFVLTRGE